MSYPIQEPQQNHQLRHDWTFQEVKDLFELNYPDLIYRAQTAHRQHFDADKVQLSTLLSIKTGACPEDCAYCSQSAHHSTNLEKEKLLSTQEVVAAAKKAKAGGATRFCMGAAWRKPSDKNLDQVIDMVKAVKDEGMETCVTLGMLKEEQAKRLADAGLDYYNHNLDTSPQYYEKIISTRTYQDRLDTLGYVSSAGLKTCCGGIVGMGEKLEDRVKLLCQLANLPEHPTSVPINNLVQIEGTPIYGEEEIDPLDFVRMIAVAKIMMPASYVRLAAGREKMSESTQALCFLAGANSIFYGEELLTTPNPEQQSDMQMLNKLGMQREDNPKYTDLDEASCGCSHEHEKVAA